MTLALVRLSERRMAHTLAYPLTRHRLSRMCLPKRHLVSHSDSCYGGLESRTVNP